jgi:hypothetical protein
LYPFAVPLTLILKVNGSIITKNFKPVFMRHNKKIIAIAAMSAIVIFIQCSKTFKKTEQVAAEEEQSGIEKKKSLIAQGKETFRFDTFGGDSWDPGLLAARQQRCPN